MSSKAITEKQTERPGGARSSAAPAGPSVLRDDDAALPRLVGLIGAALVIFGGIAVARNVARPGQVPVGLGVSLLVLFLGMSGLLFHAALDRDVQFRRIYLAFGLLTTLLGLGLILGTHLWRARVSDQYHWAIPCLVVALLFLLAFLRNEDEVSIRGVAELVLLVVGGILAVVGLGGGALRTDFLLPHGLLLAIFGLVFIVAYVNAKGISDDLAYYTALGMGVVGLAVVLIVLGRTFFTPDGSRFFFTHAGGRYFTSGGSVLLAVGLTYTFTGAILAGDLPIVVLTRRELGSFFFSPIAYLTLFGFALFAWVSYFIWVWQIIEFGERGLREPVVRGYLLAFFPVVSVMLVVPILTMRLFSEEHRSGTLEVLLTAPVGETSVVLSKFIAALLTYLLMWLPFGLYLITIPLSGGNAFDYRPLLSFGLVLLVTSSGFIAAGLFFSSLTRSQIASGLLTGGLMMILTALYWVLDIVPKDSRWHTFLRHVSYLDTWIDSLQGIVVPVYLLFSLSVAVLFLFLTVKVLESRKWR